MTPDINYAHAALFLAVGVALGYMLGLRPGYARAARQAAAFRELKRQEEAGLDRLARDLGLDPAAPAAIAPAPGVTLPRRPRRPWGRPASPRRLP